MEPVIVKNRKKTYTFYSDRLTITKKGVLTHTVCYDEIEWVTYNPKFGIVDALKIYYYGAVAYWSDYPVCYRSRAFVISLKEYREGLRFDVILKLPNEDFEKIKNLIPIDIEVKK